ncbi:ybaK/proline--tRNA ligase associated domain protein [Clostridium sp. CAG:1219]|nr:ybaK/proline--tRNA ligase associated domain protein [Clostridium sp. CAG:1219]
MNKQEVYNFIKSKNIWHEITEHEAVFNMDELSKIEVPYNDCDAKNLFVRDDKKENYYLITVKGNKRVDLKEFRKRYDVRPISFASAEDLMKYLNLIPGSVSPLGLLNDKERKVKFYLDDSFFKDDKIIGIHPNDNTATVWLKVDDLINIINEHGSKIEIINI